ncbi:uncharacterized protein [Periplaneta americana]|uniref:uncharacterized protein n=1 Tax=Periplaneta americana TaxID=6978 RepID=UPI0037E934C7
MRIKNAVLPVMLIFSSEILSFHQTLTRVNVTNIPAWNQPCGSPEGRTKYHRVVVDKNTWGRQLSRSLRKIRHQLNVTLEHIKNQTLNESYSEIRKDVERHRHVPSWVPGMGNVLILYSGRWTRLQISSYLPKLHTELQTFCVALEAIVEDSADLSLVVDTNTHLIEFLCEVEEALIVLQIAVPVPRVQRSLMSDEERNPPDETKRLVRDWGVLTKYRDYLHYWSLLLSKMENHQKKHKAKNRTARRRHEQNSNNHKS